MNALATEQGTTVPDAAWTTLCTEPDFPSRGGPLASMFDNSAKPSQLGSTDLGRWPIAQIASNAQSASPIMAP